MISGVIAVLFLLGVIDAVVNGDAGAAILGIVIILFVLGLGSASRKGDRAFCNFVDYWEKGGPNGSDRR